MAFKKHNPGCPCCDPCKISGYGWVEISGEWTAGGSDVSTDDSSAIIVSKAHPGGLSTSYVSVTVQGEDDGDILRLILAYSDSDNYLYGEIELGDSCGYARLYKRVSGSTTQLGVDVPSVELLPGVAHDVEICYDGTNLTMLVTDKLSYTQEVVATGNKIGFATGTITQEARFSSVDWQRHEALGDQSECPFCGLPCRIFADVFTRLNSTNLGCVWSEVSGAWEISSNKLKCTSSGTLICTVPQSTDNEEGGHYVLLTFNTGAFSTGNKIRAIADASSDGTSYYGVEVEVLSNKIRLYKSGTLLLERNMTATLDTLQNAALRLCVRADYVIGTCTVGSTIIGSIAVAEERLNNRYSGIITDIGTATSFASYIFERTSPDGVLEGCEECASSGNCSACKDSVSSEYLKLTFSGIANDDCSDCDIFNKTHIIPVVSAGSQCEWLKQYEAANGDDVPCSGTDAIYTVYAWVYLSGGIYTLFIQITLFYYDGPTFKTWSARWGKTFDTAPDCLAWEYEDVPYASQDATGQCDASGSTCLLTAL